MRAELPPPWGAPNRIAWCYRCEARTTQFGRNVPGFVDLVEDRQVPEQVAWSCRECGHPVNRGPAAGAGVGGDPDADFDRA
jgi:hypothetical protein